MSETQDQLTDTLNHLIALCKSTQQNFTAAANVLKDSDQELAERCARYAVQRELFVSELQDEVRKLADEKQVEQRGTLGGALRRGWMNAKALVTGGDEDVIIEECEAGEDEIKDAYEKALQTYLPTALTTLLQKHYVDIRDVHQRFSSLKKAAR